MTCFEIVFCAVCCCAAPSPELSQQGRSIFERGFDKLALGTDNGEALQDAKGATFIAVELSCVGALPLSTRGERHLASFAMVHDQSQ